MYRAIIQIIVIRSTLSTSYLQLLLINTKDKVAIVTGSLKYNNFSNGNTISGGSNAVIEII